MKYIADTVTLSIATPETYTDGDYLLVYGNGGSGAIDYTSPLTPRFDLNVASPITTTITVSEAGIWSFGAESYDVMDNASGTPREDDVTVDLVPAVPAGFAITYAGGIITLT